MTTISESDRVVIRGIWYVSAESILHYSFLGLVITSNAINTNQNRAIWYAVIYPKGVSIVSMRINRIW